MNNQKGFSLVGVVVASGILGIMTVGFMGFMANSLDSQQRVMQFGEIQSLKNEMGMLVDSEKHCRNSLAGSGEYSQPENPITFKKKDIDEDTEGLEVELYTSSQDGNSRGTKVFSATDPKLKFYSTLEILSIKLIMNSGVEYDLSYEHEDIGILRVKVRGLRKETSFDIKLSVWMRTDSDKTTTLLSCSRFSSSAPKCGSAQSFHSICGCIFIGKAGWTGSECVFCSQQQIWDSTARDCRCPQETPHEYGGICNKCPEGQYEYGGICNECPEGQYKSKGKCCPHGLHNSNGHCCPMNAFWKISKNRCKCNGGFYWDGSMCAKYSPVPFLGGGDGPANDPTGSSSGNTGGAADPSAGPGPK